MQNLFYKISFIVCFAAFSLNGIGQDSKRNDSLHLVLFTYSNIADFLVSDTLWSYRRICKSLKIIRGTKTDTAGYIEQNRLLNSLNNHTPLFSIHGNVQYDFLYRSFVDTPFSQHNFQQHTIQTSLSIVVKDHYPIKVNFSNRQSNSPYFRNLLSANMQFDRYAFTKNEKQGLLNQIEGKMAQGPDLKLVESALHDLIEKYNVLKSRLNAPDILQQVIQEREKLYYQRLTNGTVPNKSALTDLDMEALNQRLTHKRANVFLKQDTNASSVKHSYNDFIADRKMELDSLQQSITKLQAKADSLKNVVQNNVALVRRKIYKANSKKGLQKIASENGIDEGEKRGLDNFLSDIKSVGIGRSFINYSELTAWNVSLTGINVEYNPGMYAALAIGKIDFGYGDFFGKKAKRKDQNLLMGRIGIGDKDRKAVIFSAFTGRKYKYGNTLSDTLSDHVSVAGYSVEGIWRKNENTGISAEIAKTTKPLSGNLRTNHNLHNLVNFSDKSNLGVSIKAQTIFNPTDTRVSGFYKKTGESFQSFSLFTYNTDQTAWHLKAEQAFFKNKINAVAMLRRNDFTNPFTEKTFKASTIFKSFQLNVRLPALPALSVGYYPGTQLYIIDKERIRENAYYILNGSLFHHYAVGSFHMLSSFVYNRYASKGTDSGFISYQGISYIASHALLFPKLQLQGSYAFTDQEQMRFYTLEAGGDFSFSEKIRAGGAAKYNRLTSGEGYWGSRAQISLAVFKLGVLELQYEKSYLPTIQQTLYPIETGRVSWLKYF